MISLQEAQPARGRDVHRLSLSSKKKKKYPHHSDRSLPTALLLQGISHCWAVIDHHHRVSLKRAGRREWGVRARYGEGGGRGEAGSEAATSSGSNLRLFLPPELRWPFAQEPAGAQRDLIEWIPQMCLDYGWWRKEEEGEKAGDRGEQREEGEGTCHDLQRLIAWLFLGPYWSLTGAGLPWSGLAKALRALPEPRLRKGSPSSRSRATCGPINSRPARVAAAPSAPPGQSSIHRLCSSRFPNIPH